MTGEDRNIEIETQKVTISINDSGLI